VYDQLLQAVKDSQERIEALLPTLNAMSPTIYGAFFAQWKDNRAALAKSEGE